MCVSHFKQLREKCIDKLRQNSYCFNVCPCICCHCSSCTLVWVLDSVLSWGKGRVTVWAFMCEIGQISHMIWTFYAPIRMLFFELPCCFYHKWSFYHLQNQGGLGLLCDVTWMKPLCCYLVVVMRFGCFYEGYAGGNILLLAGLTISDMSPGWELGVALTT